MTTTQTLLTLIAVALSCGCTADDKPTTSVTGDDDDTTPSTGVFLAMVQGTLVDADDLAAAKATHDAIVDASQQAALDAGDFAHDVLLGTTMLDGVENEFLALDRWHDADAMVAFYSDPAVGAAFGQLLASSTITFFAAAPDWENWGTMESGDAFDPYFFHLADGVLAEADPAAAQAAHDGVAAAGKQPSIDAGNVGHIVYLGLDDPQRFVAVDIWSAEAPIVPVYTDPNFQAAFAPLFSSVSEPVYRSTDWAQW